jgi:hypothetical protein
VFIRLRYDLHRHRIPVDDPAFEIALVGQQAGGAGAEAEDGVFDDGLPRADTLIEMGVMIEILILAVGHAVDGRRL